MKIVFIVLGLTALFCAITTALPTDLQEAPKQCRNHDDCPVRHCCTIGMTRYSTPQCSTFGQTNDTCRPFGGEPKSYSLSYPGLKTAVEVESAYLMFCPCDTAFSCDLASNTCQEKTSGLKNDKHANAIEE